ncbi:uncharacterized protein LOC125236945 [Leguminivora glycinivorella]|uniref:uncharacterized protein LOC125236945 n=1 Tax=Leguminivora glycinivorella TaxID=1035111 RepID=UPI00200C3C65|nr:uncharacterized protein LOC125236945 [Leguminivora glycinivorella]
MKSFDNMRVSLFLCFLAALTQAQRNGPERRFEFKAREEKADGTINQIVFQTLSAVKKQIDDMAADVKKIKQKCDEKIHKVVKKLGAIGDNLDTKHLSKGESKLLNQVMVEGIAVEAMRLTGDVHDQMMKTLDRENAPMAAKVLVAQVVTEKLSDDTKKEIKKLVNGKQDPDDDVGVADTEPLTPEEIDGEVIGVTDDDQDGNGNEQTDEDVVELQEYPMDGNQEQAVDDESTSTDDSDSGPQKMQGNGLGYGSKKKMCLFTPRSRQYCLSQEKAL